MNFYPLQVTSIFEFHETALRPEEYILGVEKLDFPGGGIADSNSLLGLPRYHDLFTTHNKKFISGVKLSLLEDTTFFELLCYIQDEVGYACILNLLTKNKSAYSLEEIKNLKGVAVILKTNNSYFYGDNIPTKLILDLAKEFPNFYLGVEMYTKEEKILVDVVRSFATSHHLSTIAIPKILYLTKGNARRLAILQCIKKKEIYDPDDPIVSCYFMLTPKVLSTLFLPIELENTAILADSCKFDILSKRGSLLHFMPTKKDSDQKLIDMVYEALEKKKLSLSYKERAQMELGVISSMGYSDYFLIVSDYVNFAKKNDIKVGPGRGSSASSLVSYLLNITEVDPLKYDLIFERFLNPDRVSSPPDIDVDFEDTKREEVINYLKKKYGEERVGNIITFSSLQASSAINAICEIRNISTERIKRLTSNLRPNTSLRESLENNYVIKEITKDKYFLDVMVEAMEIEGFLVNTGKHAAGIAISDRDLSGLIPFSNGIALFEYTYLERMGFYKFDILGLSNLSFIREIEDHIKSRGLIIPNTNNSVDDLDTYSTLQKTCTYGVFQLESLGMRRSIETVRPSCFDDLVALVALYRPGPMENIPLFAERKNKRHDSNNYASVFLNQLLKETYGILIYQEQIMKIVQVYAGLSGKDADNFRRAISKKDEVSLHKARANFRKLALEKGHKEKEIDLIYNTIERFANYGFNKAHSVSYSLISFKLLYYKTHFLQSFYQCLIKRSGFDASSFMLVKEELSLFGKELIPPRIGRSDSELLVTSTSVTLPLSTIKGLSKDLADELGSKRVALAKCETLSLFLALSEFNLKKMDYLKLIDAGAFDVVTTNREKLRINIDKLMQYGEFGEANNLPLLLEVASTPNKDFYLESLALGVSMTKRLPDLFKQPRHEGYELYMVIHTRNFSNTDYDAIGPQGTIVLSFSSKPSLEPYQIIEASGKISKNRKRMMVSSFYEDKI